MVIIMGFFDIIWTIQYPIFLWEALMFKFDEEEGAFKNIFMSCVSWIFLVCPVIYLCFIINHFVGDKN